MKTIAIQRNRKRRARFSWQRVVAGCSKWGKPFFVALLLGGGFFTLYIAGRWLTGSPRFQVKEVRWIGLRRLNEGEMMNRFLSRAIGQNLFRLDADRIQTALLADSWVKEATIRKDFPDRLTIFMAERTPAAVEVEAERVRAGGGEYAQAGNVTGKTRLRDEEGRVLEQKGALPARLPRIVHYRTESYSKGLTLAALLDKSLGGPPLFLIDLADPKDLIVYFSGATIHLGEGDFEARWRRYLEIKDDLDRRGISEHEIDLRFPRKVVVKEGFVVGEKGTAEPPLRSFEERDRTTTPF
ncbi:MAG: FtsQ-type POTRA domain-containing protein [Candidatus Manganitrophaceae bacterium]